MNEPLRILVVDDDELDRIAIRRALGRANESAEFRDADSGDEALATFDTWKADCLLLDYELPGTDGLALLRSIRERAPHVPVIILTGQGDETLAVDLMKHGAADYLPKGLLSPERLAQSIRQAVRVASAERREREVQALLARQVAQLSFLAEAGLRVHAELTTEGVLAVAVREAATLFPSSFVIARFDVPSERVVASSSPGAWSEAVLASIPLAAAGQWVGEDAIQEDGRGAVVAAAKREGTNICGWLMAPLTSRGGARGDLHVLAIDAPLPSFDLHVLVELANTMVVALGNAHLYADAHAATKARDDVLAIVSHDLRNPLNNIALSASLLGERLADREDTAREVTLVQRISRGVTRMNRLIEDLLDASRIDAGNLTVTARDEAASTLIDEAFDAATALADTKRCTLERGDIDKTIHVRADRDRIQQVLVNLLINAIRFARGRVMVSLTRDEDRALFTVADDGVGIEPAHLPMLFERFWKAPGAPREGAGLGLFIARGLILAHGGSVRLEAAKGADGSPAGTVAKFWLPLSAESPQVAPEASGATPQRSSLRYRVRRSRPSASAARVLLPPMSDSTRRM